MRRSITIATTVAAAGVLLAAVPVGAATSNGDCDGTGPKAGASQGPRQGQGPGNGPGKGQGPQAGAGQGLMNLPMGTLTDEQKADLAYMAEEEKLAHDVYTVLGKKYPKTTVFATISNSEQRHWDAVVRLLDRYGIADPTKGMAAGEFASADLQKMYDDLLAGATTRKKALRVGVAIEKDDIAELKEASAGVTAPDVSRVYANLTAGSQRHLAAFKARL